MTLGYKPTSADLCVYVKQEPDLSVIAIYVDDLLLMTKTANNMDKLKKELARRFKMADMGNIHYLLGVGIIYDSERNYLELNQNQYVQKMLSKFRMEDTTIATTPFNTSVKLMKDDGVSEQVDPTLYQSLVGSLLYAAIATRPDIAVAVSTVAALEARSS